MLNDLKRDTCYYYVHAEVGEKHVYSHVHAE